MSSRTDKEHIAELEATITLLRRQMLVKNMPTRDERWRQAVKKGNRYFLKAEKLQEELAEARMQLGQAGEHNMTDEEGMLIAYQHGAASNKDRIRELEAALTEARLASLAHLGQAADALEAQKKAEAERDALKTKLPRDFLEAK